MTYGYARCSTDETKQDIERQTRELEAAGAELVFYEFEHGDAATKRELTRLLDTVQAGDTIIVVEVSRLSRSVQQLCGLIDQIKEKQLRLMLLNSVTIDCRNGNLDPMSQAFLQMTGVFSELELAMIRSRVRSGMANAAAKGKQIGRRHTTKDDIPAAFYRYYPLFKARSLTKVEFARLTGLSRPSIDKYLRIVEQA